MFAFLSFLLVILGCINWLMIGLLQYDFVAGIFGYQGSVFSRIIYIIVGIAALFLVFKAFADKGKINIVNFKFSFKKKKKKDKEEETSQENLQPAYNNIEASRDFDARDESYQRRNSQSSPLNERDYDLQRQRDSFSKQGNYERRNADFNDAQKASQNDYSSSHQMSGRDFSESERLAPEDERERKQRNNIFEDIRTDTKK